MSLEARLNRTWYEGAPVPFWARPLSMLFRAVVGLRRAMYRAGLLRSVRLPVPVIVVGNITVGGTGKSPLTVALVEILREHGIRCGIVSRGYGGEPGTEPLLVVPGSDVERSGDEALMLARRAHVPVCVHPRRVLAAQRLLAAHPVDVVICDDGLQHYALERDIEIAVLDAERGVGNCRMLPAGPLREPVRRLRAVDHVVINGASNPGTVWQGAESMRLEPRGLVNVATGERQDANALINARCVAVAGIGNPQRFFGTLAAIGYAAECRAFPDHHPFGADDLAFSGERPVLMTEKDAVKCHAFAKRNWWYLEVRAVLEQDFERRIAERVLELVRSGNGRTSS